MKRLKALLFGTIFVALTACGGGGNSGGGSTNTQSSGTPAVVVTTSGASAVAAGSSTTFTAAVQNSSNTAVTWQVNGIAGGNSTVGTISSSGSFTAPNLPPAGGTVTITAVLQSDSTKSGSITVTIQFSNASIQGVYAFNVSGSTGGSIVSAAGRFQANGTGTITNGVEDGNQSTGLFSNIAFTGSYSVGTDGRGKRKVLPTYKAEHLSRIPPFQERSGLRLLVLFRAEGSRALERLPPVALVF